MIKDLIKYVSKNFFLNFTRSILSIISITFGIMAIFALLSFGQGLTKYVNDMAEDMGVDTLTAMPRGAGGPGATGTYLTKSDVDFINRQRGIDNAVGFVFNQAEIKVNLKERGKWFYIIGMPVDSQNYHFAREMFSMFDIVDGRYFSIGEKGKVILGYNYMFDGKIFQRALKTGDRIYINEKRFEIIGFFDEVGSPQDDGQIYLSTQDAEGLFNLKDKYGMIYIKAQQNTNPSDLAEYLTDRLRRHKNQKLGQEDFNIETLESQIKMFNDLVNLLNGILILIALVSVLVAGVNIANTMYTTVMERTKEIGIMKSIGAKNNYIRNIFMIESGFIGICGGILGVILGYIVASIIGYIANIAGFGMLTPYFPMWLVIACILFATLIGSLSGFLPANQASKLKPVDALR
ncbi:MAG: ABC transporter permease, partial [Candidatus Woesearchaeota archaeon]